MTLWHLSYLTVAYICMWILIIHIGLSIFRIKPSLYKSQILISTILLTYVSMFLHYEHIEYLTGIVQPIGLLLCLWQIFKFKIIPSSLIVVFTFVINGLLEVIINFTFVMFDLNKLILIMQEDNLIGLILVILAMILLYTLIVKFRIGFTFMHPGSYSKSSSSTLNKKVLFLSIFGIIFMASLSYSWFHWNEAVIIVNSCLLVVLVLLIKWAYARELSE